MLGKTESIIQKWLSNKQYPVVAGISGGPDSMALLFVLVANGVPVTVAHIDHMLRENSSNDCEFVRQHAEKLGVPFISTAIDIERLAVDRKISLEAAGREARYNFLFSLAAEINAQAVVVGQTADDQAETVIMHLIRGSGSDGLRGMCELSMPNEWSSTIPLVRPLLGISREEILEYCQQQNIPFRFDLTNDDPFFFRNRIRLEVLPYLQTINPKIKSALWRTATVLGDEANYLDQEMLNVWSEAAQPVSESQLRLMRGVVTSLPVVLQRRMWRKAIKTLRKPAEIDFDMVEKAVNITNSSNSSGRYDLGAGLVLYLAEDRAWLAHSHVEIIDPDWPLCNDCGEIYIRSIGNIHLIGPWSIQVEWLFSESGERVNYGASPSQNQAWFQGVSPETQLILRCRKPGDRIVPFGLRGHSKKLSDIMIDKKIPAPARERWPLICHEETILWVPGCARSNHFLVEQSAAPILHMELMRDNPIE